MTVQGKVAVNENNSTNWLLPVGGLAVGAGAGAWKAPAKYSSFDDLVEAATKDDSFTMPTVADGADDTAKANFKTVTDAVEKRKTQGKKLAELFTGDTKEVEFKKVLEITGQENVTADTIAAAKKNEALAKMFAENAKDGETLKITDAMKKLFDTKNGETVVAGTEENVKQALKAMGADITGDGTTVTEDMLKNVAENSQKAIEENATEEITANAKRNKALAEMFAENAKKGETLKITDKMKELFDTETGKKAAKGTEDDVKQALKAMGADVTGDGATVTEDMLKNVAENGKKATEEIANTKAAAELINSAKDGKVTKEAAETFIKTGSDAAKTAFDNVKGMFGKNMWKGAGIGAVVGLAAGWVISKFMGGSKDKA